MMYTQDDAQTEADWDRKFERVYQSTIHNFDFPVITLKKGMPLWHLTLRKYDDTLGMLDTEDDWIDNPEKIEAYRKLKVGEILHNHSLLLHCSASEGNSYTGCLFSKEKVDEHNREFATLRFTLIKDIKLVDFRPSPTLLKPDERYVWKMIKEAKRNITKLDVRMKQLAASENRDFIFEYGKLLDMKKLYEKVISEMTPVYNHLCNKDPRWYRVHQQIVKDKQCDGWMDEEDTFSIHINDPTTFVSRDYEIIPGVYTAKSDYDHIKVRLYERKLIKSWTQNE